MLYTFLGKASVICGCIGVIAEVSYEALKKRYDQGWVCEMIVDAEVLVQRIREARKNKEVNDQHILWPRMCVALFKAICSVLYAFYMGGIEDVLSLRSMNMIIYEIC